jgi:hypothetical protein
VFLLVKCGDNDCDRRSCCLFCHVEKAAILVRGPSDGIIDIISREQKRRQVAAFLKVRRTATHFQYLVRQRLWSAKCPRIAFAAHDKRNHLRTG